MNYKRIPYKTVWLSYPDIEPTLAKLGAKASATKADDPSKPHYTLPAILDETGDTPVVIVDSLKIAEYLDKKYPERPVFPKSGKALEYAFEGFFGSILGQHCFLLLLPRVLEILDEPSQVYFRATREKAFGIKFEEFSPEGPVRDALWKKLELETFHKLGAVLDKNGPGISFVAGGSEPTRADFLLASYFTWIKTVDPKSWAIIEKWENGRWGNYLQKFDQWTTVC